MMNIEYLLLDHVTLEPSSSGLRYKKTTFDHGGVEMHHVNENYAVLSFDSITNKVTATVNLYDGTVDMSYISPIELLYNNKTTSITPSNGVAVLDLSSEAGQFDIVCTSDIECKTISVNVQSLNFYKQQKMAELEQAYANAFTTFQSSVLGVSKTYPINQEARNKLEELQNRLIADPNKNSFYFITIDDGILVQHTRSQFLQLLDDAEALEITLHNKYRELVNSVESATDITTVNKISW